MYDCSSVNARVYTWTVPKVMRIFFFFFCVAQKGQERIVVVVVDGGAAPRKWDRQSGKQKSDI